MLRFLFVTLFLGTLFCVDAWGNEDDKIKLKNVNVLTLKAGRMTTGRRSSPLPQLQCIGGSAGCGSYLPKVVQCINKGHDGADYQWECKADMDDSVRFGELEVSCEGYDYPTDPFVLVGSCGLRYNLDLTKAGAKRKANSYGGYGGDSSYYGSNYVQESSWSDLGPVLLIIAVFVFIVLYNCINSNGADNIDPSEHGRPNRWGSSRGSHWSTTNQQPPPYGFKPEFTQQPPTYEQSTRTAGGNGSSFWTGLGLGALGGYAFGNQRTRSRGYTRDPWGGSSSSYHHRDSSSGGGTSRTTSGFASTNRR